jgi:hypothetical protein
MGCNKDSYVWREKINYPQTKIIDYIIEEEINILKQASFLKSTFTICSFEIDSDKEIYKTIFLKNFITQFEKNVGMVVSNEYSDNLIYVRIFQKEIEDFILKQPIVTKSQFELASFVPLKIDKPKISEKYKIANKDKALITIIRVIIFSKGEKVIHYDNEISCATVSVSKSVFLK